MPGLLVPVAVVVVGHDGHPVQVPRQPRHRVTHVDNLLAAIIVNIIYCPHLHGTAPGRHGGGEQETAGGELCPQLRHEHGEGGLVLVPLLLAVRLQGEGDNLSLHLILIVLAISPASSWGTPSQDPNHQSRASR